ncbi:MAG TPA: helix-turn-helix domain-containing protein [Mycobacterium sp.]
MLAWELVVEAQALRSQGWTVSAIARHLGVTRVTVRRYLSGEATPGVRARSAPDRFAEYVEYCRLRLGADPHLWATTLFDEVTALGFTGSYPSFTRAMRERALRPVCRSCKQGATVDRAVIEHPPGAETQWDWVELPDPPAGWGWGQTAYVLIGALPASARWRGWLAESTDQPHLVEGLDAVTRRLGGLTRRWRFDRMSTVAQPQSGRLQASFGPIARHYAVGIDVCPAYHAWRKGAVEKAAGVIAQRWWRTLGDEVTQDQAQAGLDRVCVRLDGRKRVRGELTTTVGALADAEGLRPVPPPYAAVLEVSRTVSNQARIAFRGNVYSVPPGHTGRRLLVRHRLSALTVDVVTDTGVVLARHRRAPDGAGAVVCSPEHVAALEKVVLANFADRPPCRRKHRRPPTAEALAEAHRIRGAMDAVEGEQVVADFARYAAAARPMRPAHDGEEVR